MCLSCCRLGKLKRRHRLDRLAIWLLQICVEGRYCSSDGNLGVCTWLDGIVDRYTDAAYVRNIDCRLSIGLSSVLLELKLWERRCLI